MRLQTENTSQQVKPAKLPLRQRMLDKAKNWMLKYVISQSFLLPNYANPQPIVFTDAPNFKLSYVIENEELQQYLATLRNPAATEQQKISALNGIKTIYLNEGSTLTRDEITETLQTIKQAVLDNHGSGSLLMRTACNTTKEVFASPAAMVTGDVDIVLGSLSAIVLDSQLGIDVRFGGINPINQIFARTGLQNTQAQYETMLQMLETLLPDLGSPLELRTGSLELVNTAFSGNQEIVANAQQVKRTLQAVSSFVSANPHDEDACQYGILAMSLVFGRDLAQMIDNECVSIALETARISMGSGFQSAMTYAGSFMGALFRPGYNGAIQPEDMKKGMDILVSALSSPGYTVRNTALWYAKVTLQEFIDFRADVLLSGLQSQLSSIADYMAGEPDAYLKEQAIAALQAGINHKTAQFTSPFISGILATLKSTADNASLPPGTRTAAGGALLNGCFIRPEFFDASPYSTLFKLTAAIAQQMLLNSPDHTRWGEEILGHTAPLNSKIMDYKRMYDIAKANPNAPIIASIFSTTGITYYNEFSPELLQHLYDNRNSLTGKAPLFMVMTTHRGGVDMGSFVTQDYLDKFDIRAVQPGSDTTMHAMLVSTASRLGIEPKDVNASGPKFRLFTVSGHADANVIYLQPFITSEDAALLQDMGRYFADGSRGFTYGCESMGIANPPYALPLGEMMAINLGIRMFGAQTAMGGVDSTSFAFENGQWTISDIYLSNGVPRTSADYGSVAPLPMSEWTAVRVNNSVQLHWSVLSNQSTEEFRVMRSIDEKVFECVGRVQKNGTGIYSFTDASPPQSESLTYKISRSDGTPVHGDGSKDLAFAFSETREVGGVIGIGNEQEQPKKFELLQNYPNPFNSQTKISYSIPKDEKVVLKFYNMLGQEIATPINSMQQAGSHTIAFDASNLASGIYFYRIEAGDNKAVKKMVLAK